MTSMRYAILSADVHKIRAVIFVDNNGNHLHKSVGFTALGLQCGT